MNKLFATISIIAVFFCSVSVFAADFEMSDTKKMMEDLKEDRRRAEEAVSQDEEALKKFLEQKKESESAAEGGAKNTTEKKSASPEKGKTASVAGLKKGKTTSAANPKEVNVVPLNPAEVETSSVILEEVKTTPARRPGEVEAPPVSPEGVKVLPAAGVEETKVVPLRPEEFETSSVGPEKVDIAPVYPEGVVSPERVVRPEGVKIPPVRLEKIKIPPVSPEQNKFLQIATSVPVQYALYFLIVICFGFICCCRIVIYKKKVAAEKKLVLLDASLLAAVEQWRFTEGDFKRYQDKLIPLVDAQLLDINSPEFKKHFIKDLAVTEILFQAALNKNMGADDPVLTALLGQYKLHLSDLGRENNAFSNALDNYRRSLTLTAGQQVPYAEYYKDFLNLLMMINKKDDAAVLELYQRYLLINKLAGKVGMGSADAAEIQEGLNSAINNFKSEYNVIIKEEGIEPPEDPNKNIDKP